MSDFLTADIGELLNGDSTSTAMSEDDKALAALREEDRRMIQEFSKDMRVFYWPQPVRKKYIR